MVFPDFKFSVELNSYDGCGNPGTRLPHPFVGETCSMSQGKDEKGKVAITKKPKYRLKGDHPFHHMEPGRQSKTLQLNTSQHL